MTPNGWCKATIGDAFIDRREWLHVADDQYYSRITARVRNQGIELRDIVAGQAIKTKRQQLVHGGDLVVAEIDAKVGGIGVVPPGLEGSIVSSHYFVFEPDRTRVEPRWVHHLAQHGAFQRQVAAVGSTNYAAIRRSQVHEFVIELPPLPEQRKIAAILSSVDDAIESTQAVIDQLQVVKKDMMSELLTRGLPGQHTTFRKTEIGEVPEGWDVLSLECLCSHIVDCPHETPDCIDAGYPVIRTADVVPGKILLAQARRVSAETYTRRTRRLQPEAGDVLYSREGERYGIAAPVPQGVQLCLGQRMMQFRASQETDPSFLCWLLNSPQVYQQARDEVGGSTSPHVNIKSIRKFVVARPPLSEQRQIGIALDMLCEREAAEDSVVGVLRILKTALMSVLLTGELRVTPDEAAP